MASTALDDVATHPERRKSTDGAHKHSDEAEAKQSNSTEGDGGRKGGLQRSSTTRRTSSEAEEGTEEKTGLQRAHTSRRVSREGIGKTLERAATLNRRASNESVSSEGGVAQFATTVKRALSRRGMSFKGKAPPRNADKGCQTRFEAAGTSVLDCFLQELCEATDFAFGEVWVRTAPDPGFHVSRGHRVHPHTDSLPHQGSHSPLRKVHQPLHKESSITSALKIFRETSFAKGPKMGKPKPHFVQVASDKALAVQEHVDYGDLMHVNGTASLPSHISQLRMTAQVAAQPDANASPTLLPTLEDGAPETPSGQHPAKESSETEVVAFHFDPDHDHPVAERSGAGASDEIQAASSSPITSPIPSSGGNGGGTQSYPIFGANNATNTNSHATNTNSHATNTNNHATNTNSNGVRSPPSMSPGREASDLGAMPRSSSGRLAVARTGSGRSPRVITDSHPNHARQPSLLNPHQHKKGSGLLRAARRFSINPIFGGSASKRRDLEGGEGELGALEGHEDRRHVPPLGNALEFSGHYYAVPSLLLQDEGEAKKGVNRMVSLAKETTYSKGDFGFPSLAWAKKDLNWHDLALLETDDDLCADQRVAIAKQVPLGVSVGIPIFNEAGKTRAVVMLYRADHEKPRRDALALEHDVFLKALLKSAQETCPAVLDVEAALGGFRKTVASTRAEQAGEEEDEGEEIMVSGDQVTVTHSFVAYLHKFAGQGAQAPGGHDVKYAAWAFVGTLLSMMVISSVDEYLLQDIEYRESHLFMLMASFGAVATMLFAAPTSQLVQPRNLIGGHVIGVVVAISVDYLTSDDYFPILPKWFAISLVPALSIAIMAVTGLIHPPAGACSVIYISGDAHVKNMHWLFLVIPVLADTLLLIIMAIIINNMSRKRKYPLFW